MALNRMDNSLQAQAPPHILFPDCCDISRRYACRAATTPAHDNKTQFEVLVQCRHAQMFILPVPPLQRCSSSPPEQLACGCRALLAAGLPARCQWYLGGF